MSENEKPAAGEVRIVSDTVTGKAIRIEAVLADGTLRVLYPLTAEQVEEFALELTATRH